MEGQSSDAIQRIMEVNAVLKNQLANLEEKIDELMRAFTSDLKGK